MKLIITFLIVFALGPLVFWRLTRRVPDKRYFTQLVVSAFILMIVAFGMGRWFVPIFDPSPYPGLGAILLIWLAWIVVLAFCVQAVQLRLSSPNARKAVFVVGAMATTLPWFGLYAAQMMAQT